MVEDTFSVEATARRTPRDLDWNLLVTSLDHRERDLRRLLRRLLPLRASPFRNVLLARVADATAALDAVESQPGVEGVLGRVVPILATFEVDPERFASQAEAAIAPWLGEMAGRSFHVRVERRGHKGRLDSHDAERVVGTWIAETLAARGTPARVDFRDPDLVIAIEVVGDAAGIALLSRALRREHPSVRID